MNCAPTGNTNRSRWLIYLLLSTLLVLFSACGGNNTTTQSAPTPTPVPVNGFGTAANHVHAMLALPDHVLVLATHYGLFRSVDGGTTWKEVAAGPNQLMQGLMTYSLTVSPLDPNRLYVLTQLAINPHSGILGLYTSDDQGQTWQLTIPTASLTSGSIYLVEAGNDTPNQVYIYLPDLGTSGLRVSLDAGKHFSSTGTLPFGRILGLLAIPGTTGQLLAYGSDGLARSTDAGIHWQVLNGINGGIYNVATAGPHSPIYASGDAGIFASHDGGKTFTLVDNQGSFASLAVSPAQPQMIYGKTGTTTYRSSDGGRTWKPLPHISGNLAVLAVDPGNASQVYLSLSYPTAVYQLKSNSTGWQSLTPQA
jgi:photosystem II stability/assembly factor-like uncharacterized protein